MQCQEVRVEPSLQRYIVNLIRATRSDEDVHLGVSPRGTVSLLKAAKALAFIDNRDYAIPDDVKTLAPYVLAHRMIPAGGRRARAIVDRLLGTVAI